MSISVYCPALGQQALLAKCISLLHANQHNIDTKLFVIDNGSQIPLTSHYAEVIRNEENKGMVGSLRQAVEHTDAEVIVYLHSDMFIHEEGWDRQIAVAFEADHQLAALGVVGAIQADADGGRSGVVCAFRDGEKHGKLPEKKITPVALLDGCFCAYRTSFLRELDFDQFEENGYFFYDKDISLTLTMKSLHVAVIDLDCVHIGGQTSCREEFTDSLASKGENHGTIYATSENRYLRKWGKALPVRVTPEYVVHVGRGW
jgi:glycosyltransferase involved in cell wall biosynthesis